MIDQIRRGSIVIGADRTDYGKKPRPMLVVQADKYIGQVDSLTVCPITTIPVEATLFRIPVDPTEQNGLEERSYICADKTMTIRTEKVKRAAGTIPEDSMRSVDEALRRWLDL